MLADLLADCYAKLEANNVIEIHIIIAQCKLGSSPILVYYIMHTQCVIKHRVASRLLNGAFEKNVLYIFTEAIECNACIFLKFLFRRIPTKVSLVLVLFFLLGGLF